MPGRKLEYRKYRHDPACRDNIVRLLILLILVGSGLSLLTLSSATAQTAPRSAIIPPQQQPPLPQTQPSPIPQTQQSVRPASRAVADQYPSEEIAKTRCGSDPVVWVNLDSKIWHTIGDRFYGKTKRGAYMCQSIASNHGMRAAKK